MGAEGNGAVTVKLRNSIPFGSETIAELVIRPARAKDLRRLPMEDGYLLDTILILAGRLSGQPDVVINALTGEDLEEVLSIVQGFIPRSRATGSTPSES